MSEEKNDNRSRLTISIPTIKTESETQTPSRLVSKTPDKDLPISSSANTMEALQNMSIRKRRNLSKNRAQAARQREKTPEPGRTIFTHEDTTTSDDEDIRPVRNTREIEAAASYEEMKRLVNEKASNKDPEYDIDIDEILEARAFAANERRRRSISPFALPGKEDGVINLQRKGSFIDPTNKLLSTSYALNPKDDDNNRRSSLTIEAPIERSRSLSTPTSASPKDNKEFPYPLPTTPKKLEEIVYPDEISTQTAQSTEKKIRKTEKKENAFNSEETQENQSSILKAPKTPDTPLPGEIVTKVIQVERTPSKKLTMENKPTVEVRERVVRTPSRKSIPDSKPTVVKKPKSDESQAKVPPVKPARKKSSSRFGGKTSESEMSEDQTNHTSATESKRKVMPTPRRFLKNKSPRANRSQSLHRVDDTKVSDKSGMSQTSKEIIELMQKARARSLSIPKDDPRLLSAYKVSDTKLRTPSTRSTRGISCPKTIQIISDKEILAGLTTNQRIKLEKEKIKRNDENPSRQSSGYIDASQSEYTTSCYSSSPSENEFDFDLSERTAELTRKLRLLSNEVTDEVSISNIKIAKRELPEYEVEQKSHLRKRSITKSERSMLNKSSDRTANNKLLNDKKQVKSRWKLISNWQLFKDEQKNEYEYLKILRNKCMCDLLMLIITCGLGGMMFRTLEGSFENVYKCGSRSVKRDFIESLWRGSHYLREEDWKSMARKKLYEFENQLHTAHEAGVTSYSGQGSWNFMNSFVYCMTLVTTIGYGHIAPTTTPGRIATIVYAIIGIPLFLIVLADFGKLFTRIIKFFWAFIRRFYYTRSCRKVRRTVPVQEVMKGLNIMYDAVRRPSQIFSEEDIRSASDNPPPLQRKPSDVPPPLPPKPGAFRDPEIRTEPETPAPSVFEIDDEFNLPISLAIFILIIYIIIGALGYSIWEEWGFFESFYFVFISMSTIGLGDLVPKHPLFMMASILYLVFGLALMSMCINVVQVKLSDTFRQASAKLGATIGLKVAEEDGSLVTTTPPQAEIVPVHKPRVEIEEKKDDESKDL